MDFDLILSEINGFGKWQKIVLLTFLPIFALIGLNIYMYELIAFVPRNYRCQTICDTTKPLLENKHYCNSIIEDYSEGQYCTISFNESSLTCKKFVYPGYEYKTQSMVMEWDLVCDRFWTRSIAYTSHMMGEIFGCMMTGKLSDYFGRKPIFTIGITGYLIYGHFITFYKSLTFYVFIALKCMSGILTNFIYSGGFTLMIELVDSQHRASCTALLDIYCAIGGLAITALSYFGSFHNWRILIASYNIPLSIIALISIIYIIPESPRWLILKNKKNKAREIIWKIASMNNRLLSINFDDYNNDDDDDDIEDDDGDRNLNLIDLLKYMPMRAFIMSAVFISGFAFYFGITFESANFGANIYITVLVLSSIEIPGILIVRFIQDYYGRKLTLIFALLGGSLSLAASGILSSTPYSLIFAVIAKLFGTITYTSMYTLSTEIYPTGLRSQGLSLHEFMACFVSLFWPYFFKLSSIVMTGLPHLILLIWSIVTAIMAHLYIPETLHKKLPNNFQEALKL